MVGTGFVTGRAAALDPRDRIALAMVLAVRNVGVAVTVLGRAEFAVFATAYFLNQVPPLLAVVALFRTPRTHTPSPAAGTAPGRGTGP